LRRKLFIETRKLSNNKLLFNKNILNEFFTF